MVLDSKIQAVKDYFGIETLADWSDVEPHWITAIDGVGPVTLDHIRMYLAAHDVALKGDHTPEYWREHLSQARICHQMGTSDRADVCPFTILIDTREQRPFKFEGFKGDAKDKERPLIVRTEIATLQTGDYSIRGFENRYVVERKSAIDLFGCIGRDRERFEREIDRMNKLEWGGDVLVESDWRDLMLRPPEFSKLQPKTISRTIKSWRFGYRNVHWWLVPGRPAAEAFAFDLLKKAWREVEKQHKERMKEQTVDDLF